ncbi:MAG: nucleoside deaminase [Bacteroidota bacterium]
MALSVFSDEHFMKEAYKQALIALEEKEVPVGAVVVCENRIIAKAYNQTEKLNDATAHAEMLAVTAAANYLGTKYLDQCTLFVTLEPCSMCAGALYWSQLQRLVYGTNDAKRGYTSISERLVHPRTSITNGVLKDECKGLLDRFFRELRK